MFYTSKKKKDLTSPNQKGLLLLPSKNCPNIYRSSEKHVP